MSFISRIIPSKKILVVDIWTYKVKVALCEYKNWEINLLSIAEKKQEASDIIWSEIANIEWVSNTVSQAISKAIKDHNFNPKDIIINIPTSTIVSCWEKINYSRDKKNEEIDVNELDYIIWKVEKKALDLAKKEITKKTWFYDVDMKLITSSITDIMIDDLKVSNPMWFTWSNVNISTINIFIPSSRYNIINTISNYLSKNILSIIPLEFSIPKLLRNSEYAYDDVLFIDIWNTKTSVIIQKKWVIIGFDRIEIWINDLIKNIKQKEKTTTIQIINTIDDNEKYLEEKQQFLSVWESWLIISMKEILWNNINIPNNVFLTGWWDNNFLRNHIKNINLNEHMLHSVKPLDFIDIDFKNDLWISWDINDLNKTNLWILSMILSAKDIVDTKNNQVFQILKNFLEKNEI